MPGIIIKEKIKNHIQSGLFSIPFYSADNISRNFPDLQSMNKLIVILKKHNINLNEKESMLEFLSNIDQFMRIFYFTKEMEYKHQLEHYRIAISDIEGFCGLLVRPATFLYMKDIEKFLLDANSILKHIDKDIYSFYIKEKRNLILERDIKLKGLKKEKEDILKLILIIENLDLKYRLENILNKELPEEESYTINKLVYFREMFKSFVDLRASITNSLVVIRKVKELNKEIMGVEQ